MSFADRAIEARRRADEAGRRVHELRVWLAQEYRSPGTRVPGASTRERVGGSVADARARAAEAARNLLDAYGRAAEAHERAAEAHERLADWHAADDLGEYHQQRAAQHRRDAAGDRAASSLEPT
ncbi:MAG TPA: hypothetical protein VH969_09715 [Actinophytocola sp.]|uniref:hypothetical protein n=1 Tax=Actinophytocola sp. TaxID=1872138 RepID=UPI002F956722